MISIEGLVWVAVLLLAAGLLAYFVLLFRERRIRINRIYDDRICIVTQDLSDDQIAKIRTEWEAVMRKTLTPDEERATRGLPPLTNQQKQHFEEMIAQTKRELNSSNYASDVKPLTKEIRESGYDETRKRI